MDNRVALVTGGAKGMGRAIALKFAREGCDVIVNALHIEGAQKVAGEIRSLGRKSLAISADISDSIAVQKMVDQIIAEFGKIDILVNNAGGVSGSEGTIDTVTEESWDKVLSVNLKGAFLVCRAVVPHMKEKKYGKIINLSSMGAVNPSVSVLHYHSAKAGMLGLTLNLAFELAPQNIYVNAIIPGPVETPFWDPLTKDMPDKESFFKALARKEVPLGRMGTPEDIAGPALFLASGLSDYVTGQFICVAGGQPLQSHEATFISSADVFKK
ncbi:MAG: SDR family NAD(P)-dependent oxidoreductase [Bacillota bacterium]|nr:SDR family NAD(P)-dependent oxidoreductase [Bacillota bacterium]